MNDLHGHLISKASEVDQLRVDLAKMEVFLQFCYLQKIRLQVQ